jgi:hypothetical protein
MVVYPENIGLAEMPPTRSGQGTVLNGVLV